MKQIVLLALVALVVGAVYAVKHLPWWATLIGAVALFLAGKVFLKRLFFKLLITPFKMKGAVLKNATAEVHSVTLASWDVEESDQGSGEDSGVSGIAHPHLYQLDVTITPTGSNTGAFGHWEPGELRLVLPESVIRLNDVDHADDDEDVCEVKRIWVEDEGGFKQDEGFKYAGARRLRLHIGVKPGVTNLKFRYYFEDFGSVALPPSTSRIEAA